MSLSVPREVDYSNRPSALPPNTINTDVVVAPSNGQTFANDGDIIQFTLPSRGFMVPGTLYLRYKCAVGGLPLPPQILMVVLFRVLMAKLGTWLDFSEIFFQIPICSCRWVLFLRFRSN